MIIQCNNNKKNRKTTSKTKNNKNSKKKMKNDLSDFNKLLATTVQIMKQSGCLLADCRGERRVVNL